MLLDERPRPVSARRLPESRGDLADSVRQYRPLPVNAVSAVHAVHYGGRQLHPRRRTDGFRTHDTSDLRHFGLTQLKPCTKTAKPAQSVPRCPVNTSAPVPKCPNTSDPNVQDSSDPRICTLRTWDTSNQTHFGLTQLKPCTETAKPIAKSVPKCPVTSDSGPKRPVDTSDPVPKCPDISDPNVQDTSAPSVCNTTCRALSLLLATLAAIFVAIMVQLGYNTYKKR